MHFYKTYRDMYYDVRWFVLNISPMGLMLFQFYTIFSKDNKETEEDEERLLYVGSGKANNKRKSGIDSGCHCCNESQLV